MRNLPPYARQIVDNVPRVLKKSNEKDTMRATQSPSCHHQSYLAEENEESSPIGGYDITNLKLHKQRMNKLSLQQY